MKIALVGAGQRGMIYAEDAKSMHGIDVVAVAETNEERRNTAGDILSIPKEYRYRSAEEFLSLEKCADAVVLATMDQDHYKQVMRALDIGYDILLEKPISPNPQECVRIQQKANALGRTVIVCHVLRYTAFFSTIKRILDSGEIGKIVTINQEENVGNFHFAHSFVRGNWANSHTSSPIIMQKSCHDMDILTWLADSSAKKISSFGRLSYFHEGSAPEGSAQRCTDCAVKDTCRFNAERAYLPSIGQWPTAVLSTEQTRESVLDAIRTGPYGRCVYHCDNNVCDHQVTSMEFENGVTANFTLSGMTNLMHRTIHVMCEHGEIRGDDALNTVTVSRFRPDNLSDYEVRTISIGLQNGFHGGGDHGLMADFVKILQDRHATDSRSSIDRSVESHIMASAAEESRLTGRVVDLQDFRRSLDE